MLRKIILGSCMTITGLFGFLMAIFTVTENRSLTGVIVSGTLLWATWYLWRRIRPPSDSATPVPPASEASVAPAGKPFLSMFGDTFKLPTSYTDKKAVREAQCDIDGSGGFDFEVVGESHYRTTIWAGIPDEYCKMEKFRLYFVFTLQMDDDNEHDKNAVAVKIKGLVGYLPRDFAKRYRRWAEKNGVGETATCRGVVVGNKGKDYSIWLDLPDTLT